MNVKLREMYNNLDRDDLSANPFVVFCGTLPSSDPKRRMPVKVLGLMAHRDWENEMFLKNISLDVENVVHVTLPSLSGTESLLTLIDRLEEMGGEEARRVIATVATLADQRITIHVTREADKDEENVNAVFGMVFPSSARVKLPVEMTELSGTYFPIMLNDLRATRS